ncbi:MAG: hypothetical protein HY676_04865 [Chloroflexi bacterium]|nr:hypothetical protein [Chloroflexota bacterium]
MAERAKAEDIVSSQPLEGFYEKALSKAERVRLRHARQIQGLEEEIALLRVRLQTLARDHPENLELLLKGITTLIRAVSAKYRLSKQAEEDLFHSVMGVIKGIGEVLLPEVPHKSE